MKNNQHLMVGRIGEDFACRYLIRKGYRIIDRNSRKKYGEIDIVARDHDGTLVFVEVKALRNIDSMMPEDNMTKDKLRKLRKICEGYANSNQGLIKEERGWRMDVLAIEIPREDLTIKEKDCVIRYYENV